MTRASSEAAPDAGRPAASASRIIAAEALRGVTVFPLAELSAPDPRSRPLRARDLDTDVGRTAFAMGRRRGFEEGTRTGLQQGYSQGSQALDDFESGKAAEVAQRMQQLVDGFRGELQRLETQVAGELVSLAIDIARQVLRRELAHDAKALLPAAAEALRALGEGASRIELRVHPQDAQVLRAHLESQPGVPPWQLVEDSALHRGGCRIESDTGLADASFETRWQAAMESLGREAEPLP